MRAVIATLVAFVGVSVSRSGSVGGVAVEPAIVYAMTAFLSGVALLGQRGILPLTIFMIALARAWGSYVAFGNIAGPLLLCLVGLIGAVAVWRYAWSG